MRGVEQKRKDESSHPYLEVQAMPVGHGRGNEKLTPPDGQVYGTVWDRVSFSPAAKWRLTNFALAMGLSVNRQGKIAGQLEIEEGKPGTIIGKLALLRVKSGTIGGDSERAGEYRAEAGNWSPYDPSDAGNDGFSDEDEDEEPGEGTEDEDAFGEEEPDEYYTREVLESMEPKELSAVCGEFDLDPGEYKVKVRGKLDVDKSCAAMVDAILEAQAAPEEETGSDEDPF